MSKGSHGDVGQELWNVFTYYTVAGNPLEPNYLRKQQFVQMHADCKLVKKRKVESKYAKAFGKGKSPRRPSGAAASEEKGDGSGLDTKRLRSEDLDVIYTETVAEKGRTKQGGRNVAIKKMNYSDFLNALIKVAMRTFPKLEDAPEKAFQKLIVEHILAHSKRRAKLDINLDDFKEIEEEYSVPLKQMFQFYGGAASKEALKEASSAAASSGSSSSSSSRLSSSSEVDIDELEEIFHEVDEGDHGDGYIDAKIIVSESTKKGIEYRTVQALIKECDKSLDRRISFEDFCRLIRTGTADELSQSRVGGVGRDNINAMMEVMDYDKYLHFASDFNLTSSVLLTSVSLADIFLQSLKTHSLDTLGGLTYKEFWEALCRCAVVAYSDKKVSNLDKLRGLFLYMSHKVDQSVPRAVNHIGGRSVSTNAQTLMFGAKRFQWLVQRDWNASNNKDYLRKAKVIPKSGRELMAAGIGSIMNMALCEATDISHGKNDSPRALKKPLSPEQRRDLDEEYRERTQKVKPLPIGWRAVLDPNSGRKYYYHKVTKQTTWTRPTEALPL